MNTDIRDRSLNRSRRQTRGASTGHLATTNSASKTRPFPIAGIRPAVLAVGAALSILLALQMLPSGTPPLHAQGSGGNSAPVFGSSEYAFSVGEDASVGSAVGTVSASDADAGNRLAYIIVSGNEGTVFSMAASTGAITVGSALDYEAKRRYALTVQVSDGNSGTATAAVSVEVTNVLDVCSDPTTVAVTSPITTNTGLAGDCEVLLVAKDTLRGTGSLNWSTGTAIGSWDGVTVSGTPNRVTGLALGSRSLTGSIPWELGSLSELTVLDLHKNSLTESIPPELGSLSELTNLNLGGNDLNDLVGNSLTGKIPPELGGLSKLTYLNLVGNSLTGKIPPELGDLSKLTVLNLHANSLTESIPPELGDLSKVTYLRLSRNSLTGSIPSKLGELESVTYLNLAVNSLTGSIPHELGNLSNLRQLWLKENQLSGPLPSELGGLSRLTHLMLWVNRLSGEIPGELGNLSNLTHLAIQANMFTGCAPVAWRSVGRNVQDLPLGLLFCNSAPVFGSSEYAFTVGEDASVGGAVGTVSAIDVDSRDQARLAYTIVPGNVGTVFSIDEHTGAITVGSALDYEATRRYTLTVQVSDGRSGMDTAAVSVEVTNALDVCSAPGATAVTSPSTNTGLAGDCEVLLVAKDTLRGTGSLNWSTTTPIGSWDGVTVSGTPNRVTGLSLGSRSLTGSIPWELGSLGELTVLDLNGNSLTGSIPPELGSLSKLTTLSLSWVR